MVIQGTRRAETERIRWASLIAGLPVAVGGLRLKKAGESFILVVMMGKCLVKEKVGCRWSTAGRGKAGWYNVEAFYEQEHKLLDLVSGRF